MKRNYIKYLKAKRNLSDEIKNMSMEEKIKEIDEIYEILKDIPNDLDSDLLAQNIKVEEEIYYQAKASGVDKKYLKHIEELIKSQKNGLRRRKKTDGELDELFEKKNKDGNKINNDKFMWEEGDLEFIDTVCDRCIYYDKDNKNKCIQYPEGKPEKVLENEILCSKEKREDI